MKTDLNIENKLGRTFAFNKNNQKKIIVHVSGTKYD